MSLHACEQDYGWKQFAGTAESLLLIIHISGNGMGHNENRESVPDQMPDVNVAAAWDAGHRYTPGPRHRRRLLLRLIGKLQFADCLDAGCAQPYLLAEIVRRFGVAGYGCDISDKVMALNKQRLPECEFVAFDLSRETWPGGRQFDLVICSEVIEHIAQWELAVRNLVGMTRCYLVITVPGGKLRRVERRLGHHRHFQGPELVAALQSLGCEVITVQRWGYPFYDLFKTLINVLAPDRVMDSFAQARHPYSLVQKLTAHGLWALFYLNDLFRGGDQLIVLARKRSPASNCHQHRTDSGMGLDMVIRPNTQ
jgi:hypothetical protein